MLKRSKILIVSSLLALSIGAASVAMAGPRGDFSEARLERMASHLELSTEQLTQIRAIIDDARPSLRAYRDQLRDNRQQWRQINEADSVDEQALQALANEKGDLMASMMVERSQLQRAIRAVLTAEQKEKMSQMKKRHKGRKHRG